jgi:hypothetical protein
MMIVFRVFRCLVLVTLFSEVVLIVGAVVTDSLLRLYHGFTLAIAISTLTLLTVPVMCVSFALNTSTK